MYSKTKLCCEAKHFGNLHEQRRRTTRPTRGLQEEPGTVKVWTLLSLFTIIFLFCPAEHGPSLGLRFWRKIIFLFACFSSFKSADLPGSACWSRVSFPHMPICHMPICPYGPDRMIVCPYAHMVRTVRLKGTDHIVFYGFKTPTGYLLTIPYLPYIPYGNCPYAQIRLNPP